MIDETGLYHLVEQKIRGVERFLKNANSLKRLEESPELKRQLLDKLARLPHPEQKVAKLDISRYSNTQNFVFSKKLTS